jgi:hypothetical protein
VTDPTPDQTEHPVVDARQQRLDLPLPPALQSLLDLERQRIESFNHRTDVVRLAIESNDAADKRQYEFQMAKLQAETAATHDRHRLLRIVTVGGGSGLTAGLAMLVGMAFLGSPAQSDIALSILKVLGIGAGGYGVIAAFTNVVRALADGSGRGR